MPIKHSPISEFEKTRFTASLRSGRAVTHDVYTLGNGPPIVLIQELPGIGKETLRLADRLVDAGFKVVMPHFFGPLEKTALAGNFVRVLCMRREFRMFSDGRSSPAVDWIRALCRKVKADENVKGVGVIGMCLTGNFALLLMADDSVLAGVASQPALPAHKPSGIDMSTAEIAAAKKGMDEKGPAMALRFEKDPSCNAKRFACINKHFNDDGKERVKFRTLPGKGHSVLTVDFVDEAGHPTHTALEDVIGYFAGQLR